MYLIKIKNIYISMKYGMKYTYLDSFFPFAERSLDTLGFGIFGIVSFNFLRFAPQKTP